MEYKKAFEFAGQAVQEASSFFPSYFGFLPLYSCAAQVYLNLWELAGDQNHIDVLSWKACGILRKFARVFPIGRPRAWLLVGLHRWLSGRRQAAHRAWTKSLDLATGMHLLYDQGLAHYEIGRHLVADNPARHYHLAQAVDIFAKTEADYALRQSRLMLDQA
jgi:hypothetical protein